MTSLADGIRNACEITRRDERKKMIDKACKEFCCCCMRENDRSCICLDNSKCRLYKDFKKAMEE